MRIPALLASGICISAVGALAVPIEINEIAMSTEELEEIEHMFDERENLLTKRDLFSAGQLNVNGSDSPFLTTTSPNAPGLYYNWYLRASDGLFCVTDTTYGQIKWSNRHAPGNCYAPNSCQLIFQSDGNLVHYYNGAAVWHTNTAGKGATLDLRWEPIWAEMYDSTQTQLVWYSNLPPPPKPGQPPGGGGGMGGGGGGSSGGSSGGESGDASGGGY